MAADIGQELYEKIKAEFEGRVSANGYIKAVTKRIAEGTATMNDVSLYAKALGSEVRLAIAYNISPEVLPEGQMFYNIAQKILDPLLHDNHAMVNDIAAQVQKKLDERRDIRIKPQKAEFPEDRLGSVLSAASEQGLDEATMKRRMSAPAETMTQSFADDYMKENAKFRTRAGFKEYIVRKEDGKCCEWCSKLAGRYLYPESTPHDVFRRHDNCGCSVTYEDGEMRQDAWSKRTWQASPEELAERRELEEKLKPVRFSPEEAAAKEREVLDKSAQSGIIENKENRITTIEQASEYLNSVFGSVEKSVYKLDEQLIIDNAEQLRKLNEKFGVLSSDNTGFISGSKIKALAETYNDPSSSRNDLILSSTYFRNPNNLLATEKIMQERFYSMPVSDEYLRVATITHEYGHMLENEIIRSRIKPEIFEEYQAALARGERRQVALIPLRQQERILFHDIYDEIITIAKERNPDFVLNDNLSTYGKQKYYEAFAEMFMNSQCGKPNELGKAMTIFLERSGY